MSRFLREVVYPDSLQAKFTSWAGILAIAASSVVLSKELNNFPNSAPKAGGIERMINQPPVGYEQSPRSLADYAIGAYIRAQSNGKISKESITQKGKKVDAAVAIPGGKAEISVQSARTESGWNHQPMPDPQYATKIKLGVISTAGNSVIFSFKRDANHDGAWTITRQSRDSYGPNERFDVAQPIHVVGKPVYDGITSWEQGPDNAIVVPPYTEYSQLTATNFYNTSVMESVMIANSIITTPSNIIY